MGLVGVGGQLGLAAGVVEGVEDGWETLLIAAAALAAARATANGIDGLTGEGSHLVLFSGLSPPSWVLCLVLLLALVLLSALRLLEAAAAAVSSSGASGAWPGLGVVLLPLLLPAVTQVLEDDAAVVTASPSSASGAAATLGSWLLGSWLCPAATALAPAPATGTPERLFVNICSFSTNLESYLFVALVPRGIGRKYC